MRLSLAVAVVATLVIVAVWLLLRRRRTAALRARFGPEYDRLLQSTNTPADVERELMQRQSRALSFPPGPGRDAQGRFEKSWRTAQSQFVDDTRIAVTEADRLTKRAMRSTPAAPAARTALH